MRGAVSDTIVTASIATVGLVPASYVIRDYPFPPPQLPHDERGPGSLHAQAAPHADLRGFKVTAVPKLSLGRARGS